MLRHETNIDTVAMQLDFDNQIDQRNKLKWLCNWIVKRGLGNLKIDASNKQKHSIKYNLLHGNSKLATIHTGYTRTKDENNRFIECYYFRIRFAGLKSHKPLQDMASYKCLITICAYLNTTRTKYRFAELDVAIDIFSTFHNVLVGCTRKSANVKYNELGKVQYYNKIPTSYIEDYSNMQQKKNAVLRAYVYNKTAKENLPFIVTRFEVKLQNRFFLKNNFNVNSIVNVLDRYHIMHFNSFVEKQQVINQYNMGDIAVFPSKRNMLHVDATVIQELIRQVKEAYVDLQGSVVLPLLNVNLSK